MGRELQANWRLVVAGALGFGFGLSGLPFYTFGVFVEPLANTFHWKIATIQSGMTVSYLTTVVVMPPIGQLVDRIGARRVAIASIALYGLAFMLLGLQQGNYPLYCLNWFAIALAGTGTLSITWSRVVNAAFDESRGLALGLVLLGSGAMGMVGPFAAARLIAAFGWRDAYFVLGLTPALFALPVILAFLHDPAKRAQEEDAMDGGVTLGAALRGPQLWLIGLSFVLIAGGIAGLIPNLIKIETASGIAHESAVLSAGLIGVFVILGRVGCGALLDRFWAPGVAAAFVACPALGAVMLASAHPGAGAAAIAAALIGLCAGAEMDLLPYLVSRYFGLARFGSILGFAGACFYIGASIGGVALGAVYDATGHYAPGLIACAALFALAALFMLLLGPYPNFGARPRLAAAVDL